jgi:SAM-dependent methyltransferase
MEGPPANDVRRVGVCPACGGADLRPWRKGTFDSARLDASSVRITDSGYGLVWDLGRCLACGHIFADPSPAPELVDRLYGELEDPLYDAEAGGRGRNFVRVLRFLEKTRPAKGLLLDVGAATGILMDLARRRGWAVEGVEPSAWAVRTARERYGLEVREGVFESAPLPAAAYDVVTMVDVIEHTARPADAVARAAEVLKQGGILCIVTPDVRSPAARLAGRRWWHYRPAHLSYFSRRSLDALLARAGFRVFARRRYAWTFSAHYLASRLPATRMILRGRRTASLLRRISIKLALGDSFEIYAWKD